MREYRKEIFFAILKIAGEIAKSLGVALLGVITFIFEILVKSNVFLLIFSETDIFEFISFEMFASIGEYIENIKDYIHDIKDARAEIKEIKEEQIKAQLETKAKNTVVTKPLNDSVIEYIRDLLFKIEVLPTEDQQAFTKKLKEVLADYTSKYIDSITNPKDQNVKAKSLSIVRQKTTEKLSAIDMAIRARINIQDKVTAINLAEQELLSLMDSKESTPKTLELKH
ncbi:MAG: hypothetical protein IKP07_02235 [Bacilli bacterium]|nr:hypothetical protein [Bacilli bacterium]